MAGSAVMILHGFRASSPVVTDTGCCLSAARRLLKRGEFRSVEDLVARVIAFIADDNRTATPFR